MNEEHVTGPPQEAAITFGQIPFEGELYWLALGRAEDHVVVGIGTTRKEALFSWMANVRPGVKKVEITGQAAFSPALAELDKPPKPGAPA